VIQLKKKTLLIGKVFFLLVGNGNSIAEVILLLSSPGIDNSKPQFGSFAGFHRHTGARKVERQ
jgi:hypothetical protein